ncbi:MAG: ribosome maturation factor RimM [Candidatus Cybelea sp.]
MTTRDPTDVVVGRIVGVFGVRGELKCDPTSSGRTLVCAGAQLRCARNEESWTVRVTSARPHKNRLLIRLAGVDDADVAAALAGSILYAPRIAIALSDGEYLDEDLAGCTVFGTDGRAYGSVDRVEHYPSSDMLVVGGAMVPMVRAIVTEIDVERRRILIDPPEGLFD